MTHDMVMDDRLSRSATLGLVWVVADLDIMTGLSVDMSMRAMSNV